ncbi:TRAP transporter small permease [Burkholderiaceae bacterium FT117]|uniref:TRAP transporter small permease n=1 Tax=Zeimonas sediminis TaxID=2944268 RepID=UPI002342CB38|nr:TRAP transporter small permease [Zeimonas sediminis]MCM5569424.1 TRAP transporter small permease [Zeimonas sediminis]
MSEQARAPRGAWRRFTAAWHRVLSVLLAFSVAILIVPVSLQIFSRYTPLIPSYIWTEEMARFLFVWLIMIGAMVAMREGTHFIVDVWPVLSPKADAALSMVSGAAVLLFALVFVYAGWEFTEFAFNRISELAELPLWMIHVAWPLLGVSWLAFHGERMVDAWRVLTGRQETLYR